MTIILIKPHQLRNLRKYKMWIHAMPDFSAETPNVNIYVYFQIPCVLRTFYT